MTMSYAIEEVKRHHINVDFTPDEFLSEWIEEPAATAIATILNAVVKGELCAEEKQDPYWSTY